MAAAVTEPVGEAVAVRGVRLILLAALVFGMVGTLAELLLLEHTETVWQLVPVALLGLGLLLILWRAIRPSRGSIRTLQVLALVYMAAGLLGWIQHYSGNEEFELEMYPDRAGSELMWESLMGATPVLAPGVMVQLGLLVIAYAYRHPLTRRG